MYIFNIYVYIYIYMGENINFWSTVPSICVCLCLSVCVWVRNINLWSTVPSRIGQNVNAQSRTLNAKFQLWTQDLNFLEHSTIQKNPVSHGSKVALSTKKKVPLSTKKKTVPSKKTLSHTAVKFRWVPFASPLSTPRSVLGVVNCHIYVYCHIYIVCASSASPLSTPPSVLGEIEYCQIELSYILL
jgi:hypothetical protein